MYLMASCYRVHIDVENLCRISACGIIRLTNECPGRNGRKPHQFGLAASDTVQQTPQQLPRTGQA